MLRHLRLVMFALVAVTLVLAQACAHPPRPRSTVEIVSWSIHAVEDVQTAYGPGIRVSGIAALRLSTDKPSDDLVLRSVDVVTNLYEHLQAAVEPVDGTWPVRVRRGADEERTIRFEVEVPMPPANLAGGCYGATPPTELSLRVRVTAAEGDLPQASTEPLPIPGYEAATTSDWGFRNLTLASTMLTGGQIVEDVAIGADGSTWLLYDDLYTGFSVLEVGSEMTRTLRSGVSAFRAQLGATDAGPVLSTWTELLRVEQLTNGAPWGHSVYGAGAAGTVDTIGARVVIGYPAFDGVLVDGNVIIEPTEDTHVIIELDALSGAIERVTEIGGGFMGVVIGTADGGLAYTEALPLGESYVVAVSATLEERYRVPTPNGLAMLLEEGTNGEVYFVIPSGSSNEIGRISATGELEWITESSFGAGARTSLAPLASGELLVANGDGWLHELDASGGLVRSQEVACDSYLFVRAPAGTAYLGGFVGATITVDGTTRDIFAADYPSYDYRAVRAHRP